MNLCTQYKGLQPEVVEEMERVLKLLQDGQDELAVECLSKIVENVIEEKCDIDFLSFKNDMRKFEEYKEVIELLSKENIIKKCTDKPWRSYILAVEDGSYIISGGASQGLVPGDVFNVYSKGKIVKNPQSGVDVELPGKMIGTVTVEMSVGDTPETEISFCSYQGEKLDEENLTTKYYISEK